MRNYLIIITLFANIYFSFTTFAQSGDVYLNPEKPLNERIKDLISHLTLEEKVNQLLYNSPAIPRLNIPAYNWWNEALHGVGRSGVATVFPQAIGLGATFDTRLAYRVSSAISDEARAMYNAAISMGYYMQYGGLTFWTPNINIFRDPRWGRGQETYGEDPVLTAYIGASFVRGLQGNNPKYLKVAACAKHFAVHSGPERLRHEFNAIASKKDLFETYLPAFKALVDSGVESVMCAYNRTNGYPCCGNNYLIDTVLRKQWGFKGHVVSDCDAVTDFYKGHNVVKTKAEAAAMALTTGVNLNCGSEFTGLFDALKQGLIKEYQIDSALAVLLTTRFKLGLFDSKDANPYNTIPLSVVNSKEHRDLAREVALKSIVMLKNNGVLPLNNNLPRYFVTGPYAASIDVLMGNYFGVNNQMVTVLEGVANAVKPGSQLQYRYGCLPDRDNVNPIDWATGEAKSADVIIAVIGISGLIEGEEGESVASPYYGDRLDYNIPQSQINFLKKLRKKNTKPIIAVVTGGSPMNMAVVDSVADAILLAWYPGEEGGNAIADIIFGKQSPSGKLPVTFPKSFDQLPAYEDYSMKGRTYRYMEAEPMFPFGFGLSYGHFEYSGIQASSAKIKSNQSVTVKAKVTNSGKATAEDVVQLYITNQNTKEIVPLYALKDFRRITLTPGETREVSFTVTPDMMSYTNENGDKTWAPGIVKIYIGGSSPCKRSTDLGIAVPQEIMVNLK